MEAEQREYRWSRLSLAAAAIRVAMTFAPAAMVSAYGLLLLRYLPRSGGHVNVFVWLAITAVFAAGVLLGFEALAARLRSLAALLDISMVFAYQPPSRLLVALTSPYHLELASELDGLRGHLRRARRARGVDDDIAQHRDRVESILTLAAITGALEPGTRTHSERVAQLANRIAVVMGLDRQRRRWLRWAALLHDVGKLTVPDEILHKPSSLDAVEREIVRGHVQQGARIIEPLVPLLGPWARAVAEHHERWDGKGYPRGLRGDEISLAGRIVAVADAYATMTGGRIYQRRVPAKKALAELQAEAGKHFDPEVVRSFTATWHARRSPRILLRLPRVAAATIASAWTSLGLPAASSAGVLGIAGAVAVVAITAPAVSHVLPRTPGGPLKSVEGLLGVDSEPAQAAAAPTPAPAPKLPSPSPRPAARPSAPPAVPAAAPQPPAIHLPAQVSTFEGVAATLSGTVAYSGPAPTVTVDYGDGSPVQPVTLSGQDFHLAHFYMDEGSYHLVVTATASALTASAMTAVEATEYHASVSLPSQATAQGGTFSSSGELIDPSADVATATVDYGDGTGPQPLQLRGRAFSLAHAYPSSAGTYIVTVTFQDDDGAGPVAKLNVTVPAPAASAG